MKLSVFEYLVRDKCIPELTVALIQSLNSGHIIILQVQKVCQAELADCSYNSFLFLLSSQLDEPSPAFLALFTTCSAQPRVGS